MQEQCVCEFVAADITIDPVTMDFANVKIRSSRTPWVYKIYSVLCALHIPFIPHFKLKFMIYIGSIVIIMNGIRSGVVINIPNINSAVPILLALQPTHTNSLK